MVSDLEARSAKDLEARSAASKADACEQIAALSVRELKEQLTALGVDFSGAVEKRDLQELLLERQPAQPVACRMQ